MPPTKAVLTAIEATNLLVFTLPSAVLTSRMKKEMSTNKPYDRAKTKVKGAVAVLHKAVRTPPITAI